eukprot:gene10081-10236_t
MECRAKSNLQGYTWLDWLEFFLPCVRWLRRYRIREYLLWDIVAGISVGFMVVPQGMSYANLAGVPSVYGLYGAFLPVLVYAFVGSSRELAVGPVAVTSLLISSTLKQVVPGADDITNPNHPSPAMVAVQESYNRHAIRLSLLVACMYTAVGVLNLGFLTNFLSHSVIGGFTSGAAIIIGLSQLKYILGYSVPRADKVHEAVAAYIEGIDGFIWQEWIMGSCLLTFLLTMKYFGKRYPSLKWLRPLGPISACAIAIIAVVAGRLQDKGIRIVGNIPRGLPAVTVSWWSPFHDFQQLAPLALVVMVVDLLESTSIARALAAKGNYELNTNQEIVGLGLANFAGSAFNAYSTTGSFSRSAVNFDSGCKTALSGFVTACVVGLVLMCLTPVFEKLPMNVMGAIVISGVSGLFEYEQAVHLFKVHKLDWLVWMTSFLSTMFLGVEIGLAISIGLALLIVIYQSAFPHTALLGRVGHTTIYRNVKQFPDSQVLPGIAACRIDAPMYFANFQYIHERIRKYVARAHVYSEAAGLPLQYLLLDMSPVTHVDSTGAHLLEKLHAEMKQQGVQMALCNPSEILERTGFPEELGREWIFVRMHDAVTVCLSHMVSHGQTVLPTCAIDSAAVSPRHRAGLQSSPGARSLRSRGGPADTSDAGSGAVILGLNPSVSVGLGHVLPDGDPEAAGFSSFPPGDGVSGARGASLLLPVARVSPVISHSSAFADVSHRGVAIDAASNGGASSFGDVSDASGLGRIGSAALGLLDSLRLAAAGATAARSGSSGVESMVSQQDVSPLAGRYQSLPGGAAELGDPLVMPAVINSAVGQVGHGAGSTRSGAGASPEASAAGSSSHQGNNGVPADGADAAGQGRMQRRSRLARSSSGRGRGTSEEQQPYTTGIVVFGDTLDVPDDKRL